MTKQNSLSTIDFIQKISDSNKTIPNDCLLPMFVAATPPRIPLPQYANRIASKTECSESCFVFASVYIQRLRAKRVVVNQYNVHRLFLVSVLLAIKYLDDDYFNNFSYAMFGGIPLKELNSMEQEMLDFLDYRLMVTSEEFEEYNTRISAL